MYNVFINLFYILFPRLDSWNENQKYNHNEFDSSSLFSNEKAFIYISSEHNVYNDSDYAKVKNVKSNIKISCENLSLGLQGNEISSTSSSSYFSSAKKDAFIGFIKNCMDKLLKLKARKLLPFNPELICSRFCIFLNIFENLDCKD
jgi:hypothetical protein